MKNYILCKLLLFFCFLHFTAVLDAQNSYFVKDSVITYGEKYLEFISNKVNSKFCLVHSGDTIIKYSPIQVSEYGFEDGSVFIAKKVQLPDSIQTVFLERLIDGPLTLYYYESENYKTFFISKDSADLKEIPFYNAKENSDFRKQLCIFISDCKQLEDASKLVKYNRIAIKEFFKRLNNCDSKHFPALRYGFTNGVKLLRLNLPRDFYNDKLDQMNYQYIAGYSAGFFVEVPIFPSAFSGYSGLNFSKHGFSYFKHINEYDVDFVLNITSIEIPFTLKYTLPIVDYRPYLTAGVSAIYHIRNKAEIFETKYVDNVISPIIGSNVSVIDNLQYGFILETGMEKRLDYRHYLSLGLKYSLIPGNIKSFGSSEFSLITRISF